MKKKILYDVKVNIELNVPLYSWQTKEQYAKSLESAVRDFKEFLKDHRSQDVNELHVEYIFKDVCSFCGEIWEIGKQGEPFCCDKAQDEWCSKNNMVWSDELNNFTKNHA